MVYNTDANVRAALNWTATTPTAANIDYWQTLIDAMITVYKASPNIYIAAVIELNRLNQLFQNSKFIPSEDIRVGRTAVIAPLTKEEKEMLDGNETNVVDILPIFRPGGYTD